MAASTFELAVSRQRDFQAPVHLTPAYRLPKKPGFKAQEQHGFTHDFVGDDSSRQLEINLEAKLKEFSATAGQTLVTSHGGCQRVFFGLGLKSNFTFKTLCAALAPAFAQAKPLNTESVAVDIPAQAFRSGKRANLRTFELGKAIGIIAHMTLYEPNHYKTEWSGFKKGKGIKTVTVTLPDDLSDSQIDSVRKGLETGKILGTAVNLARNLQNEPANKLGPKEFADRGREVAAASRGAITCAVWGREEIEKHGLRWYASVGKGSGEEQQFIKLEHKPADAVPGIQLAVVGKSVMFDTGGNDLKPADGMKGMEFDMSGGAIAMAFISAVAALKVPLHVVVYLPATTNRIGPNASLPGDVEKGKAGMTMENDNTDAEGRLCLHDAIAQAREDGATYIIDLATLTGAQVVSLGDVYTGIFTNNQPWIEELKTAADEAGELVWQMPQHPDYAKQNRSKTADIKNTGGRMAGSITAAHFVLSAAGKVPGLPKVPVTPAIHCDIAGTANRDRATDLDPTRGTGCMVRTLVALAQRMTKWNHTGKKPVAKQALRKA